MLPSLPVTVTLDGSVLASSTPAWVARGTVFGPVVPFVASLAARLTVSPDGSIVVRRSARSVTLHLGRTSAETDDAGARSPLALPCAPVRVDGALIVPLASVARALGFDVRFAPPDVLAIDAPAAPAIAPLAPQRPAPGPYVTFAPAVAPTPARPAPSLVPQPRRTPISEFDPP